MGHNPRVHRDCRGLTLVEVVVVLVIAGILAAVAVRSLGTVSQTARVEETKREMDALARAITGNPELQNNGTRSDFGYVGDVGSMPANLAALVANPGGYSTWKGPYFRNRLSQIGDDYVNDAWGVPYSYAGSAITSTGSGSSIVRRLSDSVGDLLQNQVTGTVFDLDGTPPGPTFGDSIVIRLALPNGSGGMTTVTTHPDAGGYFAFGSVPIGNHNLDLVYLPLHDTLHRFVSVSPASIIYSDYYLASNVWYDTTGSVGGLGHVAGSDTSYAQPQCNNISFWIVNNSGHLVTINSLALTWSSPTAYYRYVIWGTTTVFDSSNPMSGSGQTSPFSPSRTVDDGARVRVQIESFKSSPTGGANVDMSNTTATVQLSDGSTFTISTGACQ
jgi:prepilin-type N-terminal cleavage/methylation domain-containing protein